MASGEDFKFLSQSIIFVLVEYTVVLVVFLAVRRRQIAVEREQNPPEDEDDINDHAFSFDLTTKFDDVLDTPLVERLSPVLTFTRIISFFYFFLFGCVLKVTRNVSVFNYFENWCVALVALYFFLASVSGIVKFCSDRTRSAIDIRLNAQAAWSMKIRILGMLVHLLFEVAGGTSMFVLVLYYTIGDKSTSALDIVYLMTFIGMFIEMCLNSLKVRFDQYPANIAFLIAYLLVIWPAVFIGSITTWPYHAMETKTATCFKNYFVLFLLNFILYTAWYALYKAKKLTLVYLQTRRDRAMAEMEMQYAETASRGSAEEADGTVSNPTLRQQQRQHRQRQNEFEQQDLDRFAFGLNADYDYEAAIAASNLSQSQYNAQLNAMNSAHYVENNYATNPGIHDDSYYSQPQYAVPPPPPYFDPVGSSDHYPPQAPPPRAFPPPNYLPDSYTSSHNSTSQRSMQHDPNGEVDMYAHDGGVYMDSNYGTVDGGYDTYNGHHYPPQQSVVSESYLNSDDYNYGYSPSSRPIDPMHSGGMSTDYPLYPPMPNEYEYGYDQSYDSAYLQPQYPGVGGNNGDFLPPEYYHLAVDHQQGSNYSDYPHYPSDGGDMYASQQQQDGFIDYHANSQDDHNLHPSEHPTAVANESIQRSNSYYTQNQVTSPVANSLQEVVLNPNTSHSNEEKPAKPSGTSNSVPLPSPQATRPPTSGVTTARKQPSKPRSILKQVFGAPKTYVNNSSQQVKGSAVLPPQPPPQQQQPASQSLQMSSGNRNPLNVATTGRHGGSLFSRPSAATTTASMSVVREDQQDARDYDNPPEVIISPTSQSGNVAKRVNPRPRANNRAFNAPKSGGMASTTVVDVGSDGQQDGNGGNEHDV